MAVVCIEKLIRSYAAGPGAMIALVPPCGKWCSDIRDEPIAPPAPWQNGFAERLIGSIRRARLDHLVVLGEAHLRQILQSYAATRSGRTGPSPWMHPAFGRFSGSGTLRHTLRRASSSILPELVFGTHKGDCGNGLHGGGWNSAMASRN
jgi:hypothetical protein